MYNKLPALDGRCVQAIKKSIHRNILFYDY